MEEEINVYKAMCQDKRSKWLRINNVKKKRAKWGGTVIKSQAKKICIQMLFKNNNTTATVSLLLES